ncbi:MAG TPA: CGNR zinc finger domain-containing protein [Micromonosporaceae bacterium]|nr:CGNR zinc finger domain-containing protein [Micromonosporaceae bacterium]
MDFEEYARQAVRLVNAPIETVDDVRVIFGPRTWWEDEVTDRDVAALRRARKRLRDVFELAITGKDTEVVDELNALLASHPVQPRISGHDARDWHMHVTGRGASVSAEYLAGAVWGLAVWLCEYGSARFGVCADDRCADVYLDTSSNCCRRFCSERCATRSHVAAHRARKRAEAGTRTGSREPVTTPTEQPVG